MKSILSTAFLLITSLSFAQNTNESVIYSFQLKSGKNVSISLDSVQNHLIYRCTKKKKVELEVRDDLNDTITVFSYSWYLRGGGKQNAGMDRNHFCFDNNGTNYAVYYLYAAEEESTVTGVIISDSKTKRIFNDLEGKINTVKGSLIDFRFNELIPVYNE